MNFSRKRHPQRGAALLVCLVLLLGLTVVGIASMKETITQQKVVNAIAEDDTAFQAAEFALREGEEFVKQYARGDVESYNGKSVSVGDERENEIGSGMGNSDLGDGWWKKSTSENWDRGADAADYPHVISSQKLPSFVVEILGEDAAGGSVDLNDDRNTVVNYRVTARGYGVNSAYYVVLQSTYGVQQ